MVIDEKISRDRIASCYVLSSWSRAVPTHSEKNMPNGSRSADGNHIIFNLLDSLLTNASWLC